MTIPEISPDLPGWTFEVDEVSAGVFRVIARKDGRLRIDITGFNGYELLRQAIATAKQWELL